MIFAPFRRSRRDRTISALYGAIVAQARRPAFYRSFGVPDSLEGRLEMILLHAALLLRRLRAESPEIREMGQRVFDHFCSDMDDNLRELGVGDLTVPKQIRRIGEAFYGRAAAYDAALDSRDEGALAGSLARNIFAGSEGSSAHAAALSLYVRHAATSLGAQEGASFLRGELGFPDPSAHTLESAR
jgi:cytochrome b pre-mRNA-processing protein 3